MAYTLQYSDGTIVVNDGTINGTTSIQLPGRNFAGYGQYMDQNLIDLMQNFARVSSSSGPANAMKGQLWYNSTEQSLNVKVNASTTQPQWKKLLVAGEAVTELSATSVTADNLTVNNTLTTKKLTTGGAGIEGTITGQWKLAPGSTLQSTYADLAERFEADSVYEPGTVVEIGGEKEITAVKDDCSENVFGVISANAAYLMNAAAGNSATHPAIAIAGRVPVKVRGKIRKGDRLVSAGLGFARAARSGEATSFNTVGRALENKETDSDGSILATVTVKL
jgi:hypothetical protein